MPLVTPQGYDLTTDISPLTRSLSNLFIARNEQAAIDKEKAAIKAREDLRTLGAQLLRIRKMTDGAKDQQAFMNASHKQRAELARLAKNALARGEDISRYEEILKAPNADEFNTRLMGVVTQAADAGKILDKELGIRDKANLQRGPGKFAQDKAGNKFLISDIFDPIDGSTRPSITPMGEAQSPVGKLEFIGGTGQTAAERDISRVTTARTIEEKKTEETIERERGTLGVQEELKPGIERKVTTAREEARAEVAEQITAKQNLKAYGTYQVARDNLTNALQGTRTGFFTGKLPAATASAQIADNAQKILFPAIKSLVREAGEGIFTDRDALDVQAMMPTRETHPDAIPMVMYQIDSYIASKLGQPPPAPPTISDISQENAPKVIKWDDLQ